MCRPILTIHQQRKKAKGLCVTSFCAKKIGKGNFCFTCIQKKYSAARPFVYAYNNHKQNAKRRKIKCTLTLEQFEEFATKTFYMDKRGKHYNSLHMDRIDENHGYHYWNIQALPNVENIKKYHSIIKSRKALEDAPF